MHKDLNFYIKINAIIIEQIRKMLQSSDVFLGNYRKDITLVRKRGCTLL